MKKIIKKTHQNKRLKATLFFAFYFFFFLFLAIYIKNNNISVFQNNMKDDKPSQNKVIKNYNIDWLSNNYKYQFIINDDGKEIVFKGEKDNIDYNDFENKYFLNLYNVNQIIKNSKHINSENNLLTYEVTNDNLNNLLNSKSNTGVNRIDVYVDDNTNLLKVIMDLSSYMQKEKYTITLSYQVGDSNE